MKKFYIFKDGIVKSTGFDTLEEAKQLCIALTSRVKRRKFMI